MGPWALAGGAVPVGIAPCVLAAVFPCIEVACAAFRSRDSGVSLPDTKMLRRRGGPSISGRSLRPHDTAQSHDERLWR